MSKNKSKILITGGTGFIGRNLVEQLKVDFEILHPTSAELDLINFKAVEKYLTLNKIDQVIHCATHNTTLTSSKDKSQVFSNNIRMFLSLTKNNHLYRRMFYFGSGAEYGTYNPSINLPITRSKTQTLNLANNQNHEVDFGKFIPQSDYGLSKYIMASLSQNLPNVYNLCLYGVFGKYEDWRIRFISQAICLALHNKSIVIAQNAVFDYVYIDNLAKIISQFLLSKSLKHQRYNLCTGQKNSLVKIAKMIIEISGNKIDINLMRKGSGPEYSGRNSRLMQEFPETMFTPLAESLKFLYTWYSKRVKLLDPAAIIIH